jgi:RNA polymerase sigma factor (sigma-70 family)
MIAAIKQGDAFAYEQAYAQYKQKVYAYFKKKTGSEEDAKDLLQITFLKLWQYRSSLSESYLLDQHLFHIARTVFIDHLRRQNKLTKVKNSSSFLLTESDHYTYTSAEFDIKSRLQNALASMPELRKKVFELNRLQGYSYREVAELLSISVKAVDNNLTKALRQLRKMMILLALLALLLSPF